MLQQTDDPNWMCRGSNYAPSFHYSHFFINPMQESLFDTLIHHLHFETNPNFGIFKEKLNLTDQLTMILSQNQIPHICKHKDNYYSKLHFK